MQADQQRDAGQLLSCSFCWDLWTHGVSYPFIMPTRPYHVSYILPDDHNDDRTEMPPSSHLHAHTHTCVRAHISHCLSVAPLPNVPSFLSSQPMKPTFSGHLYLVWLPPPTLAPVWQLPTPSALRRPGPRARGRAHVEQVDAVLLEVEQDRGGVTGAGGVPGSLHPCLQRSIKRQPVLVRDSHSLNLQTESWLLDRT